MQPGDDCRHIPCAGRNVFQVIWPMRQSWKTRWILSGLTACRDLIEEKPGRPGWRQTSVARKEAAMAPRVNSELLLVGSLPGGPHVLTKQRRGGRGGRQQWGGRKEGAMAPRVNSELLVVGSLPADSADS